MTRIRKSHVENAMNKYNELKGETYFRPETLIKNYDVYGCLRWFVDVNSRYQRDRILGDTLADSLETVTWETELLEDEIETHTEWLAENMPDYTTPGTSGIANLRSFGTQAA